MAVYWAALIAALFYLAALPVRIGAAWRTGDTLRVGLTIGLFRLAGRIRIQYENGQGLTVSFWREGHERVRRFTLTDAAPRRSLIRDSFKNSENARKYLLSHLHSRRLMAHIHLSMPNAAHNALLWGLCDNLLRTLRQVRPSLPLDASVSADFHASGSQIALLGILSCRLGHIMTAGLILLRDSLCRRLHTWTTDSPSKAS